MRAARAARVASVVLLAGAATAASTSVVAGSASAAGAPAPAPPPRHLAQLVTDGEAVPGQLVVGLRAGTTRASERAVAALADATVVETLRPTVPGAEPVALVEVPTGKMDEAAAALARDPAVRYVEANLVRRSDAVSNDPYYTQNRLWGMYGATTQPKNSYGSRAGEAWAAGTTGSAGVVVAVVDSGIEWYHQDLAGNIWANPYDPVDGVDNDGNGYVDDVRGYDFWSGDNDPDDVYGHGTHVSGTIGAVGGNGIGVVGVNWDVSLLPVRVSAFGSFYLFDEIAAFDYLTGLKTLHPELRLVAANASFGGDTPSQAELEAISRLNSVGILLAAAAGNGGSDGVGDNNDVLPVYPAGYDLPNIIAVAATTAVGTRASFSNYGPTTVDLGAPGDGIWSTFINGQYISASGTSMAAPHVAGAIGLCASTSAALTPQEIRQDLLATVAPTASLTGVTVTSGRLDVNAMVYACKPHPPAAPVNLVAAAVNPWSVALSWTDQAGDEQAFWIDRSTDGGKTWTNVGVRGPSTTNPTWWGQEPVTPGTRYSYRVWAVNAIGLSAPSNVASITMPAGTVPTAPAGLTAVADDPSGTILLHWTDTSSSETGFQIERSESGGVAWSLLADLPAGATAYEDGTFTWDVTMTYRVRATVPGAASGWSNEATARMATFPPASPGLMAAAVVVPSSVQVVWVDMAADEDAFEVERSDDGGPWTPVATLPPNAATWLDTKAVAGESHEYRVRARNSAGPSAWSTSGPVVPPRLPFTSVVPARLFDTRSGAGGVPQGPMTGGTVLTVSVVGRNGLPTTGVGAVTLNVTAVGPARNGWVTVFPCGPQPTASNLNYLAGQTTANAVISAVSGTGQICLFTSADTQLLADVTGWFPAAATGFEPAAPQRLLDTRSGLGGVPAQKLAAGQTLEVPVAGVLGVPATGVSAVSLNVTAVLPATSGWVTVFPCGAVPTASNVNYPAGTAVATAVVAPLSPTGTVCFFTSAETDLVVDVAGAFVEGVPGLTPLTPARLFDTRSGEGGVPVGKLDPGKVLRVHVAGAHGVPATGASAVSLSVTVTQTAGSGWITVFPCGAMPTASTVNYTAGRTVANLALAALSPDGDVCFFASAATQLLADVSAWFPSA